MRQIEDRLLLSHFLSYRRVLPRARWASLARRAEVGAGSLVGSLVFLSCMGVAARLVSEAGHCVVLPVAREEEAVLRIDEEGDGLVAGQAVLGIDVVEQSA